MTSAPFSQITNKKILLVSPYFYPALSYGGAMRATYDLSKQLIKSGVDLTIFTTDVGDSQRRLSQSEMTAVKKKLPNLYYFRNVFNQVAYRFNIHLTPGMVLQLAKNIPQVDLVHINDFFILTNIWIALLARLYRKPYVITAYGCLEPKRLQQKKIYKFLFLKLVGKWLLAGASACVAVSDEEVNDYVLQGVEPQKIVVIPNAVNMSALHLSTSQLDCRKAFSLPTQARIGLYLGRIHSLKGLDMLVKGFSKIKDPKAYLCIVGPDDGFGKALNDVIDLSPNKSQIIRFDLLKDQQKKMMLKACDFLVYPSLTDSTALSILEAASIGLPLLLTKGARFPQIQKANAGLIVSTTIAGLQNGLIKMYHLPISSMHRMGRNGHDLVKKEYSIAHTSKQLIKMYADVIRS